MIVFFIAISVVSILLAVRFLLLGAWVVLPFTVIELLVLGVSFYMYERSSRYWERIVVKPQEITISSLQGASKIQDWMFNCCWVQVIFQPDPRKWYPSKLFLSSQGKLIQIGTRLTEADRESLAEDLKRSLADCRGAAI